jgi:hypothetical protein
MSLGDPNSYRARAAYCARLAATTTSPIDKEKFNSLTRIWLRLSYELEEPSLIGFDEWSDREKAKRTKRHGAS